MNSGSLGSRANSTDSPRESCEWKPVNLDRSRPRVATVGQCIVADGWGRTRIGGTQDSAAVVYRHADATREAMRRRLREVLNR